MPATATTRVTDRPSHRHTCATTIVVVSDHDSGHDATRSPSRSVAPSQATSTTRGVRRTLHSLDNIDEWDAKAKGPLLLNSPRSLLACAKEGVDPATDLVYRPLKEFVFLCKGDVDAAKLNFEHSEAQRAELLEILRARRRSIIEAADEPLPRRSSPSLRAGATTTTDTVAANPEECQNQQQLCSSASARSSSPLSGDDEDHPQRHPHHRSPLKQTSSTSSLERGHGGGGGGGGLLSPEAFARQQAEERMFRVSRQVEKMKRVAEANRAREEAQLQHLAEVRRKMRRQEIERQEQQERDEVLRFLRDRAARKRDAELAAQKERREAAVAARFEELRQERERREHEERCRDAERQQRELERRAERERELLAKHEQQQRRLETIQQQGAEVVAMKAEDLAVRISQADEQRHKLQALRDAELQRRKAHNAMKQAENAEKRQRALQEYSTKIGRYEQRLKSVEEAMRARERRRHNLLELRRIEAEERDRRRDELQRAVAEREAHQREDLSRRLQEEEQRRQEDRQRRLKDLRLRMTQKDIEIEDRQRLVRRAQRRLEQSCLEAGERFDAKMRRIAQLQEDVRRADAERKRLQHEMFKERGQSVGDLAAAAESGPGPGEYAVLEAERKLAAVHSVRMGGPPVKSRRLQAPGSDIPGPGTYSIPSPGIRPNRGVKLPPRYTGDVSRSSSALLPPITKNAASVTRTTVASTEPRRNRGGKKDVAPQPAATSDDDFQSLDYSELE